MATMAGVPNGLNIAYLSIDKITKIAKANSEQQIANAMLIE